MTMTSRHSRFTLSTLARAAALSTLVLGSGVALAQTIAPAKVAFLMPDQASTRYEEHDAPGFIAEMKKLCAACEVIYQNADGDASRQQQQFNAALAQGVKAVVLDPVDSTAAASLVKAAQAKGVKVIAYDRPIPSAKADYYVSFNNEGIGKAIADSLVAHLKAKGIKPSDGGVLQVNGSPTDAAAGLIKKGIHAGLDKSGYKILAEYDTPDWVPAKAQQWVSGQISRFGKQIVGVVAANDGTGGGAIAAFKAAGVKPVPPVSGNDATLAALQLIVAGDQYNTISKPSEVVAAAAAQMVVKLLADQAPQAELMLYNTPSQLFTPAVVTAENLKAEVIDKVVSGKPIQSPAALCVDRYADGCKKLGIQ
jgi:D-xylose transport system substrate-binding protein